MSLFRYAFARLCVGFLALALLAMLLNAMILSHGLHLQSAAALAAATPPAMPLALAPSGPAQNEVHVLVRIDDTLDVALPGGKGRLVLLSDPAAASNTAAKAALLLSARDLPAFDAFLARHGQNAAEGSAPVVALNGLRETPFWIDRAERAATDANRTLDADVFFIRPFLTSRAEGLAPSPLTLVVPAVLAGLLFALMWSEVRVIRLRRRAIAALDALPHIDRRAEDIAARAAALTPEDGGWVAIASLRQELRHDRARLQTAIAQGDRAGRRILSRLWLVGAAAVGIATIVPRRPLIDMVSTHLVGIDLHSVTARILSLDSGLSRSLERVGKALSLPADGLAAVVIDVFGPQSVGMAETIRSSSVLIWTAIVGVIIIMIVRRGEAGRNG